MGHSSQFSIGTLGICESEIILWTEDGTLTPRRFQMVNKLQTENIKAFEPKAACVRELHNHTHELMKRLVWSARCNSWFKMGKKNGPVTAVYPGYVSLKLWLRFKSLTVILGAGCIISKCSRM
jgi:hypothetical protein